MNLHSLNSTRLVQQLVVEVMAVLPGRQILVKFLSFLSWLNCQDYPGTVVHFWINFYACFVMAVLSTAVDPRTAFQT
jgi:hypothetical protein